jgi:hypothetical protein
MSPNGALAVIAGLSALPEEKDGGPAETLRLSSPWSVAAGPSGDIFVADTGMNRLVRITREGTFHRVADTGKQEFVGDEGPAAEAGLACPDSLAIDLQGNIYIADRANWRVRIITRDGIIHTIAGNHETGFSGDGGPALKAPIFPTSVAVDARGTVYVTDHNRLRVLTPKN